MRLKVLQTEEDNYNEVIRKFGTKYPGIESVLSNLAIITKEQREIEEGISQINEYTQEARVFITDPDKIKKTALELKTYTPPRKTP